MSLVDELQADRDAQRISLNPFASWLVTLPAAKQAEWKEALKDRSWFGAGLFRVAKKQGYTGPQGSLESYRRAI